MIPKFLRPEVLAFASVAILHARLTDTEPELMSVCAWHTPKPELDRLNAAYPGQISHGLCDACAVKQEAEFVADITAPQRQEIALIRRVAVGLAALALMVTIGCGASPVAPSAPAMVVVAPTQITYAINLPNPQLIAALKLEYPDGVLLAPLDAQAKWNYTAYYGGSPNVYGGPTVPLLANLIYKGVGILTCPVAVAAKATFSGSEWAAMASATETYQWVGRFAYAAAGPGLDPSTPNPPSPTCTTPTGQACPGK